MPLYYTTAEPGLFDADRRRRFSEAVMETHCDITGAPPSFVRVIFFDDGNGELRAGTRALVVGSIRGGRTDEQLSELRSRLLDDLCSACELDPSQAHVALRESDASWSMEAGRLIPEPGSPEEADWKAWAASART